MTATQFRGATVPGFGLRVLLGEPRPICKWRNLGGGQNWILGRPGYYRPFNYIEHLRKGGGGGLGC